MGVWIVDLLTGRIFVRDRNIIYLESFDRWRYIRGNSLCMPIIYSLIDPTKNEIYYIGYTERTIDERLKDHLRTPITNRTKILLGVKINPIIKTVEEGIHVNKQTELFWIKKLHSEGVILENQSGIVDLEYLKRETKSDFSKHLPENERLRIALIEILNELPHESSVPIVVRIKHIAENALSL